MALATLAQLKTQLGITGTALDARLTQILAQAEACVTAEIDALGEQATVTEYYRGDGTDLIILRRWPVQSITSVHVDHDGYWGYGSGGPFGSADLLTAGTDYALELESSPSNLGFLRRLNGTWPATTNAYAGDLVPSEKAAPGNIKVVYVAGYSSVPADLQLVVLQTATAILNGAKQGGPLTSESIEGYSYSLAAQSEAAKVIHASDRILSRYRDWW